MKDILHNLQAYTPFYHLTFWGKGIDDVLKDTYDGNTTITILPRRAPTLFLLKCLLRRLLDRPIRVIISLPLFYQL